MPKQEHTGSAIAVTAVTGAQRAQRDFENLAAQRVPVSTSACRTVSAETNNSVDGFESYFDPALTLRWSLPGLHIYDFGWWWSVDPYLMLPASICSCPRAAAAHSRRGDLPINQRLPHRHSHGQSLSRLFTKRSASDQFAC